MSLNDRIEELDKLGKRYLGGAVFNLGLAGVGYAYDMKGIVYIAGSVALGYCVLGITNNNSRNELIRREEIQSRFGERR
jgi:hypothetical protein